jgi:hypothetical protein
LFPHSLCLVHVWPHPHGSLRHLLYLAGQYKLLTWIRFKNLILPLNSMRFPWKYGSGLHFPFVSPNTSHLHVIQPSIS